MMSNSEIILSNCSTDMFVWILHYYVGLQIATPELLLSRWVIKSKVNIVAGFTHMFSQTPILNPYFSDQHDDMLEIFCRIRPAPNKKLYPRMCRLKSPMSRRFIETTLNGYFSTLVTNQLSKYVWHQRLTIEVWISMISTPYCCHSKAVLVAQRC